jgi:hypothetical protein
MTVPAELPIGLTDEFWTTTLPAELIMGAGLGLIFVPLGNVALAGVDPHDAGAASAAVSATQQVGGSLGVALMTSIAVSAATSYVETHGGDPLAVAQGTVHSFQVGFAWAAAFLVVAGITVLAFVRGNAAAPAENAPLHIG